jgi:hypothetical protein
MLAVQDVGNPPFPVDLSQPKPDLRPLLAEFSPVKPAPPMR